MKLSTVNRPSSTAPGSQTTTRRSTWRRAAGITLASLCIISAPIGGCAQSEDAETASPALESSDSPLLDLLGIDLNDPDSVRELERERERAIQTCMKDQGFDYLPPEENSDVSRLLDARTTLSGSEFAERFGYGIVELGIARTEGGSSEEQLDQRDEAYADALAGNPELGIDGCELRGEELVSGRLGKLVELEPLLLDLDSRIANDPVIIALTAQWQECMFASGYDYPNPEAARHDIRQRFDDLAVTSTPASAKDAGRQDTQNAEVPSSESIDEIEDLQTYERELATTDFSCMEPLDEPWREIRRQFELDFVNSHTN